MNLTQQVDVILTIPIPDVVDVCAINDVDHLFHRPEPASVLICISTRKLHFVVFTSSSIRRVSSYDITFPDSKHHSIKLLHFVKVCIHAKMSKMSSYALILCDIGNVLDGSSNSALLRVIFDDAKHDILGNDLIFTFPGEISHPQGCVLVDCDDTNPTTLLVFGLFGLVVVKDTSTLCPLTVQNCNVKLKVRSHPVPKFSFKSVLGFPTVAVTVHDDLDSMGTRLIYASVIMDAGLSLFILDMDGGPHWKVDFCMYICMDEFIY